MAYHKQSGALNESLSDVFGALTVQYLKGQSAQEADWLIGKGLFTSRVKGRAIRDMANKDIEAVRAEGKVGASLQANITVTAPAEDHALLTSLGDDLKFVFITSKVTLLAGDALSVQVAVSEATKCERCWHYADDVGHDAAHPTLCGRCTSNLYGAGETRTVA